MRLLHNVSNLEKRKRFSQEMASEVVHFDRDAVGGVVARQKDVVPVGVHVLFGIRSLQTDPQARERVSIVWYVQDDRLQELNT